MSRQRQTSPLAVTIPAERLAECEERGLKKGRDGRGVFWEGIGLAPEGELS